MSTSQKLLALYPRKSTRMHGEDRSKSRQTKCYFHTFERYLLALTIVRMSLG